MVNKLNINQSKIEKQKARLDISEIVNNRQDVFEKKVNKDLNKIDQTIKDPLDLDKMNLWTKTQKALYQSNVNYYLEARSMLARKENEINDKKELFNNMKKYDGLWQKFLNIPNSAVLNFSIFANEVDKIGWKIGKGIGNVEQKIGKPLTFVNAHRDWHTKLEEIYELIRNKEDKNETMESIYKRDILKNMSPVQKHLLKRFKQIYKENYQREKIMLETAVISESQAFTRPEQRKFYVGNDFEFDVEKRQVKISPKVKEGEPITERQKDEIKIQYLIDKDGFPVFGNNQNSLYVAHKNGEFVKEDVKTREGERGKVKGESKATEKESDLAIPSQPTPKVNPPKSTPPANNQVPPASNSSPVIITPTNPVVLEDNQISDTENIDETKEKENLTNLENIKNDLENVDNLVLIKNKIQEGETYMLENDDRHRGKEIQKRYGAEWAFNNLDTTIPFYADIKKEVEERRRKQASLESDKSIVETKDDVTDYVDEESFKLKNGEIFKQVISEKEDNIFDNLRKQNTLDEANKIGVKLIDLEDLQKAKQILQTDVDNQIKEITQKAK